MLPPKVIVSPIDFSTHSNDALGTAADLASRFGSEVCLVHVVPAIPKLPSARTIFKEAEYELALHADAEKQLGQMAEALADTPAKRATSVFGCPALSKISIS